MTEINILEQAVIIAGGLGTRLGSITKNIPKPMVKVGGVPFLEIIIKNLKKYGIRHITIAVGFCADQIVNYFEDGRKFGVEVDYSYEEEPAGTGGFLILGQHLLEENFLVINGDTLFDFDYFDLYKVSKISGKNGAIAGRFVNEVSKYGAIHLSNNRVVHFNEKGSVGKGLISGGAYIFNKKVTHYIDTVPISIETDLFPEMIKQNDLICKPYNGFFIDIGIPETLEEAGRIIPDRLLT